MKHTNSYNKLLLVFLFNVFSFIFQVKQCGITREQKECNKWKTNKNKTNTIFNPLPNTNILSLKLTFCDLKSLLFFLKVQHVLKHVVQSVFSRKEKQKQNKNKKSNEGDCSNYASNWFVSIWQQGFFSGNLTYCFCRTQ